MLLGLRRSVVLRHLMDVISRAANNRREVIECYRRTEANQPATGGIFVPPPIAESSVIISITKYPWHVSLQLVDVQ